MSSPRCPAERGGAVTRAESPLRTHTEERRPPSPNWIAKKESGPSAFELGWHHGDTFVPCPAFAAGKGVFFVVPPAPAPPAAGPRAPCRRRAGGAPPGAGQGRGGGPGARGCRPPGTPGGASHERNAAKGGGFRPGLRFGHRPPGPDAGPGFGGGGAGQRGAESHLVWHPAAGPHGLPGGGAGGLRVLPAVRQRGPGPGRGESPGPGAGKIQGPALRKPGTLATGRRAAPCSGKEKTRAARPPAGESPGGQSRRGRFGSSVTLVWKGKRKGKNAGGEASRWRKPRRPKPPCAIWVQRHAGLCFFLSRGKACYEREAC